MPRGETTLPVIKIGHLLRVPRRALHEIRHIDLAEFDGNPVVPGIELAVRANDSGDSWQNLTL